MPDVYQLAFLSALESESSFQNFKRIKAFTEVLEHISKELGTKYLKNIKDEFSLDRSSILEYTEKNDSIGNAQKEMYNDGIFSSSSSLRYIYHSLLILKYLKSLNKQEIHIVEVGCGYGGLCLAIDHFSKRMNLNIASYSLIDIDVASSLQQKYLSNHKLSFPTHFHSANNYGKDVPKTDLFLISNYCFSELDMGHQKGYLEHLFPKCSHGFILWNSIDYYDIGKPVTIFPENPQTDLLNWKNKEVYF
jgi:hypothetical protein